MSRVPRNGIWMVSRVPRSFLRGIIERNSPNNWGEHATLAVGMGDVASSPQFLGGGGVARSPHFFGEIPPIIGGNARHCLLSVGGFRLMQSARSRIGSYGGLQRN